jgi:hypothetical protein
MSESVSLVRFSMRKDGYEVVLKVTPELIDLASTIAIQG